MSKENILMPKCQVLSMLSKNKTLCCFGYRQRDCILGSFWKNKKFQTMTPRKVFQRNAMLLNKLSLRIIKYLRHGNN